MKPLKTISWKNEKENAEQAFKKKCENLLYSAMPKNLTKKDCHAF